MGPVVDTMCHCRLAAATSPPVAATPRAAQAVKRMLVFVLLGPLVAGIILGDWGFFLGMPLDQALFVLHWSVVLSYIFGVVPAFLTSLVDIALARTRIGSWPRAAMAALGGLMISGSVPSAFAQMAALHGSSARSFIAVGLLGAVCGGVCSYVCGRDEGRGPDERAASRI
ncbi:hypothetical protein [Bradyrhizobium sp. LHD-71]|uniref:hypothetical protein n=1 Tax=Bradyrhizobium sp. LHD-71 TaxID=3072141 RepID=UPI00280DF571|nr:hypothetical protein [Bradyrhizobium sp. LHD-71]MDQ8729439.1 hypothetical protein [Bradyrhizobium sp. LHD-71]